MLDYKLVDVPGLGYFSTDRPHPRGELLVRSTQVFPGYYKRPDITAEVFDDDGFYRTGDIVVDLGPDQVQYLDRRSNVLELAQGEFRHHLQTRGGLRRQRPGPPDQRVRQQCALLLAAVVPTDDAMAQNDPASLETTISASLQQAAKTAGLQSYELPRDFLVEPEPVHAGETDC